MYAEFHLHRLFRGKAHAVRRVSMFATQCRGQRFESCRFKEAVRLNHGQNYRENSHSATETWSNLRVVYARSLEHICTSPRLVHLTHLSRCAARIKWFSVNLSTSTKVRVSVVKFQAFLNATRKLLTNASSGWIIPCRV